MSMWSLRWHFTNKSVTGAPYSIKCYSYSLSHTAEHYGEEYDDWNSAVLRSRRTAAAMAQNERSIIITGEFALSG